MQGSGAKHRREMKVDRSQESTNTSLCSDKAQHRRELDVRRYNLPMTSSQVPGHHHREGSRLRMRCPGECIFLNEKVRFI